MGRPKMSWTRPIPARVGKFLTGPETAKNLLEGKTCDLCGMERDEDDCCIWLGGITGWAWVQNPGEGTCPYWEEL